MAKTKHDWTRIDNDVNGNPRYVVHFSAFITAADREAGLTDLYTVACKRANRIGGRKYHNKRYGGGIVFQSYSLDETEAAIERVLSSL